MTGIAFGAFLARLVAASIVLGLLVERAARDVRRALQDRRARIEAMRAALGPLPDDEPGREVYP